MSDALAAYAMHYTEGKRHPLAVEDTEFNLMVHALFERGNLTEQGCHSALKAGKLRINGVLVVSFVVMEPVKTKGHRNG